MSVFSLFPLVYVFLWRLDMIIEWKNLKIKKTWTWKWEKSLKMVLLESSHRVTPRCSVFVFASNWKPRRNLKNNNNAKKLLFTKKLRVLYKYVVKPKVQLKFFREHNPSRISHLLFFKTLKSLAQPLVTLKIILWTDVIEMLDTQFRTTTLRFPISCDTFSTKRAFLQISSSFVVNSGEHVYRVRSEHASHVFFFTL